MTEGLTPPELSWIRSHVERCLEEEWGLCRVTADADGDYPFRWGTAACWVGLDPSEPVLVRVWAHAAIGVRRTAKLLAELNDVNSRSRSAWVSYARGTVAVDQSLHPAGLSQAALGHACASVGTVADDIGALVASVFGGSTPFPAEDQPVEEEAS